MQQKAIIVSAPSGAGKTTIVKALLSNERLNLAFSISACCRAPRPNEVNGKDYHFYSSEAFKELIDNNAFVEWEEVYPNQFYGTLKSSIDDIWKQGKTVIFDVDVVGGLNLKKHFGSDALSIFIQPPSFEVLQERLTNRATESEEKLKIRLNKAKQELKTASQFDLIVVNSILEDSIAQATRAVDQFLNA